ncbi:MAG: alpha/beta hydrolase [Chthonomonadales bacterium]
MTFRTTDGWTIHGRFYPDGKGLRAVVLLHQRGGSSADWDDAARKLSTAGLAVLAIDQRGAGASLGPQNGADAPWDTTRDIAGAVDWLKHRGFKPRHVALAGASYGANNCAIYASRTPEVPAVALVSPGANYHGLQIPEAFGRYPGAVLVLTARDDAITGGGPQLIKRLKPAAELKVYPGDAHGTALFADQPASLDALVEFLKNKS